MPTKPITINQALVWGKHQLKSKTAGLDARVLLEYVTKLPRVTIAGRGDKLISSVQWLRYQKLITKRLAGIPVAYLVGKKEFLDFEVVVNRHVLIPRPATEAIVETTVRLAKQFSVKQIYDIGTGSGVIAIAIARRLPTIKIVASDISQKALQVANRNISDHQLTSRIKLVKSRLGDHVAKASLVVANLPYLSADLKVAKELTYEPKSALFVAGDGLDLYRRLFENLRFNYAVVELGSRQYPKLAKWLAGRFAHAKITPVHDIDKTICGLQIIR